MIRNKTAKKIAIILLLVLLINMFTSCQSVNVNFIVFLPFEFYLFCGFALIVFGVILLVKDIIHGSGNTPKNVLDKYATTMNILPQTKIDSLTAFIRSLPEAEFNSLVENVYSISEEELYSLYMDVNSLNERKLFFAIKIINALPETEIISMVKKYIVN